MQRRNFFTGFCQGKYLQFKQVASEEHVFQLRRGGELDHIVVAYETYGRLSPNKDNVILVTHALTGDSHPAKHDQHDRPGWWEDLIGSGCALDTDRYFVICSNVLGGCLGTTGPSMDRGDGRPFGLDFPLVTVQDMVHVQKRLLETMGIHHLIAVIGGSMGGMQALEWAVTYPGFTDGIVALAAPGYSNAQAIAFNKVGRQAVKLDPAWQQGNYYGTSGPEVGLGVARSLGMITYQTEAAMASKFGRGIRQQRFEVENYLEHQGQKLADRFDANSYLYLLRALDLHDLGSGYVSYQAALARIEARVLIVGVTTDLLYPVYQQQDLAETLVKLGVKTQYIEIDSPHGHDGFLIDFHLFQKDLKQFIYNLSDIRLLWGQSAFSAARLAYKGARILS